MYKCPNCEFECASEKLLMQHMEREKSGMTENEQKRYFKKLRKEKEKRKNGSKRN